MIPLQPVALGLLVVALVVDGDGWDLLPDWAGWALVLVGTRALPVRRRGPLIACAGAALLVSAVVWPPGVAERVFDTDSSLAWALSLPQLAYLVLLADGLRHASREAGETGRSAWFATAGTLAVAAAVLPVPALALDLDGMGAAAALTARLAILLLVVLGLASARATWAGGHPRPLPGGLAIPPEGPAEGPPEGPPDGRPHGPTSGPDSDSGPKSPRAS